MHGIEISMADASVTGTLVEGIGDDIVGVFACLVLILVLIAGALIYWNHQRMLRPGIHTESRQLVEESRHLVEGVREHRRAENHATEMDADAIRRRRERDLTCPICLADAQFPVETNCGHLYCGQCIVTYWQTGRWTGTVRCPTCRQQVTLLLKCFSVEEQQNDTPERDALVSHINHYNRRFSGEPISWIEYIHDLPTILRHCFSDFFSIGGIMWMFRLRILVCFILALLYLVSPLDIIPEIAFGIFGFLDDLFIVLLFAIYISIIYRRYVATREEQAMAAGATTN